MRHLTLMVMIALAIGASAAAPATGPADIGKLTEQLRTGVDSAARVKAVLGEPARYVWGAKTLDANALPQVYIMRYAGEVGIVIVRDVVSEIRFNAPGYKYLGKVGVGSSKDEVLAALGQPTQTVKGQAIGWIDGVLYEDADGHAGLAYYARLDKQCRVFMKGGVVTEMSLGTNEIKPAAGGAAGPAAQAPATRPG